MTAGDFLHVNQRDRWIVMQAIRALDDAAEKVGITLDPSFDPTYLDGHVWPLNPRYSSPRLTPRNFVHVMGSGGTPEHLVTRSAIRLYNWYDGKTFATESRSLSVYYDHPEDAPHTDQAIILAPIADRIHGRVTYNGAVWIADELRGPRPELNGGHVSTIVSTLSRLLAVYLFDVDWCVATAHARHVGFGGPTEHYGWANIAFPSHAERVGDLSADVHLMWSRRADILEEASRIAEHGINATPPT